jgi:hypothetical protein
MVRRAEGPVAGVAQVEEWLLIDTNKIRHVYSSMFYPPNDLPVPNWRPFDGNFPLPAELASPASARAGAA